MLGVDTNVLVRFFVSDDVSQAAAAKRFMQKAKDDKQQILVNLVVLCELVWVLESGYDFSREEIATLLQRILSTKQFEIQNKSIVWRSLDDYRNAAIDFADCIIGRTNANLGATVTLTFDRGLKRLNYFEQLEATAKRS